ncbi:hypothetical protein INR49_031385 [Caranx melampygus]|nr:hypothetical protein INR49_031452 [Caranx melampygus]KAG7238031.1 hypothetical protein INR49_031385 [Caranx melampygus]
MNTHLLYCVRVQQCSLVKVTPRSGRFIRARKVLCSLYPLSSSQRSQTSAWTSTASEWPCLHITADLGSGGYMDDWRWSARGGERVTGEHLGVTQ